MRLDVIRGWTCLLFACAAAVAFWQSSRIAVLWDLTYVLEIAHRINLGVVPYRDYVVPQPPLTFLIQAAILRIFEPGYLWPRVYCAVIAGSSAALTYRIIRTQLDDASAARSSFHAVLLSAPVVFLNGYAILPLPFYDPDCAFFVLLAVNSLLSARRRPNPWRHVAAGMLLVLPLATKQNVGLATLVIGHALLMASAIRRRDRREWRAYILLLIGSASALVILVGVLQFWAGLPNYAHWTIAYAAQRRWPSTTLLVSPYLRLGVWITVACAIAGYLLLRLRATTLWTSAVGAVAIASPLLLAARTMARWGLPARAPDVWGLGTFAGGAAALTTCIREQWRFEPAVPILALGVAHAAFASQGLYDSAYGVWPLLLIAFVPLVDRLSQIAPPGRLVATVLLIVMSAGFSWLGFRHVARHERLGFADLSGAVQAATLPAIRGLAVPGTHIADFERLVKRSADLIPADEGVMAFPGEDPFFLASGRRPRLPIVLFDDTAMPYDGAHLLRLLEENEIRWVVVKDRLQLRHRPWRYMESFLTDHLPSRYELVESLPGYRILRRRPTILAGSHLINGANERKRVSLASGAGRGAPASEPVGEPEGRSPSVKTR